MFIGRGHAAPMPAPGPPRAIKTPCVQVCAVDDESGLCLGCFRSLAEIAGWVRLTDGERDAVLRELGERRSRIAPAKLG
jgi:predicted Fe-S protein YdhL (DUF1289 family)